MRALLTFFTLSLILFACKPQDNEGCASAGNCEREVPEKPRTEQLRVEFRDSVFLDINSDQVIRIEPERIESGNIGSIPVYSHLINLPLESVQDAILDSRRLFQMGVIEEDFNKIPYFTIKRRNPNENYQFQYIRRLGNKIVAGASGNIELMDSEYAYLPMINEVFGGQLSSILVEGASSGDYIHQISITANSPNARDSEIKNFNFRVLLSFPTKSFLTEVSEEMQNFNLKNRWEFYYKDDMATPNDDVLFASILDAQEVPDSQSADLRIVFREPPVLRFSQVLFEEETVDLGTLRETGNVIVSRGNRFIERVINLNSANHFRLRMSVNGEFVDLDGNNEVIVRNIPPDTRWDMSFHADFNRNQSYPNTRNLLSPLRPMCQLITRSNFNPISHLAEKSNVESEGGFYSVCHPETNKTETISQEDLPGTSLAMRDTWYDFFSYRRSITEIDSGNLFVKDVGHFYGLKEVRFSMSGCLRVYSREASALSTNPNPWDLKSEAHEECGIQNDQGWVHYNISYSSNIADFRNDFADNLDLQLLIDNLLNRTPVQRSDFNFNGDTGVSLERFY